MEPSHDDAGPAKAKVVSFDEALLDACPADLRADLLQEAALLIQAFAPEGRADQLAAMAKTLSSGLHAGKRAEQVRARRLAAALRHLAQASKG